MLRQLSHDDNDDDNEGALTKSSIKQQLKGSFNLTTRVPERVPERFRRASYVKKNLSFSLFPVADEHKKRLRGRTGKTGDELWKTNELNLKTQKSYLAKPLKNFPIAMKSS